MGSRQRPDQLLVDLLRNSGKTEILLLVTPPMSEKLNQLRGVMDNTWREIFSQSKWVNAIETGDYDIRLYALYLIETYHYTLHNARNQAMVATNQQTTNIQYMRFCLKHAYEEVGHEMMAFHDLKTLGLNLSTPSELPDPLMATDIFVAYVYWASQYGNVNKRMGYSYWAESSYGYVEPIVKKMQNKLGLANHQMTFFTAHVEIDVKHAEDVERAIRLQAKTDEDWCEIEKVMTTSLKLTAGILDGIYDCYKNLDAPEHAVRKSFLEKL